MKDPVKVDEDFRVQGGVIDLTTGKRPTPPVRPLVLLVEMNIQFPPAHRRKAVAGLSFAAYCP